MVNIFEKLSKMTKSLNNENNNYWENDTISWDKEAKGPDGNSFNEKMLYESIRESDIKRLLKYQ